MKDNMHKTIKFIYALLIITIISGGAVLGFLKYQAKSDFDQNTSQFESTNTKVLKEDTDEMAEKSQRIVEISKNIVGTWQAYSDPEHVIVYSGDRSYHDIYDNEIIGGGTWSIIESLKGSEFTDFDDEDSVYLKQVNNSLNYIGEGHNFYYSISFERNPQDGKTYLYTHYYGGAGNGDSSYYKIK